jgi:hypothetical protein
MDSGTLWLGEISWAMLAIQRNYCSALFNRAQNVRIKKNFFQAIVIFNRNSQIQYKRSERNVSSYLPKSNSKKRGVLTVIQ